MHPILPKRRLDRIRRASAAASEIIFLSLVRKSGGLKGTLTDIAQDAGNSVRCKDGSIKTKSEIAKDSHNAAKRDKQLFARESEEELQQLIGGDLEVKGHNREFDLEVTIDGKLHGIEVKTFADNSTGKVTVGKNLDKKVQWTVDNDAEMHLVVFDKRHLWKGGEWVTKTGVPGKDLWSGHIMYYRCGVRNWYIKNMTPVKNRRHLLELIASCKESIWE